MILGGLKHRFQNNDSNVDVVVESTDPSFKNACFVKKLNQYFRPFLFKIAKVVHSSFLTFLSAPRPAKAGVKNASAGGDPKVDKGWTLKQQRTGAELNRLDCSFQRACHGSAASCRRIRCPGAAPGNGVIQLDLNNPEFQANLLAWPSQPGPSSKPFACFRR